MKPTSANLTRTPALVLAAALQVMPIVRAALPMSASASSAMVMLFRWVAGAAAALGGIDSVSGASTLITNPLNASATNGQPFSLRLTTAPDQAHYWMASGLPASLTLSGTAGSAFWILTGTPMVSGVFAIDLTAKDQITSAADRTCTATLMLSVVDVAPPNTPPSVTVQPTNTTATAGQTAIFDLGILGSAPLSYQWRMNGSALIAGTNSTLILTSVGGVDAGGYDAVVSNGFGSVTSAVATLTVNFPPAITVQPQSLAVLAGQPAVFGVTATGTGALRYYWRKGPSVVASGTNANYTIANAQPANAGTYSVIVSNVAGTATSANITLTVNQAPLILTQPTNGTVTAGQSIAFVVSVAGTAPLHYQWQQNGSDLPGRTNATLLLTGVTSGQAGSYAAIITNAYGSVTSSIVTLTVNVPPAISAQPQSLTLSNGQDALFSVTASGSPPPRFFWRKGASVLVSGANATFTVTNAQLSDAGSYSVIASNVAGTITSAAAVLTINQAPFILAQPTNNSVVAGNSSAFSVLANGTAPLAYQWSIDGIPLNGATNSRFVLNRTLPADAGGYSVVITNALGSVTSTIAMLSVTLPPDTIRPTIAFTAPAATVLAITSNSFRFTGTAKDDLGLLAVRLFPVTGVPITASGTSNWSAVVNLGAGTNVFRAASFDLANNASLTNTRTIVYRVASPLTLAQQGPGTIKGATNGQLLEVGRGYTLTALPGAGYVFSNWTGGLNATANPLPFLMESNLALTAHFVINPFIGLTGVYNGLFQVGSNLDVGSAGAVSLLLKPNGTFTARLLSGRNRYSLAGHFDLDGQATHQIIRKATNNLTVGLALDLQGPGRLMGSVSDGSWSADLTAYRAAYNARLHPATNLAGLYTLLVPGAADDADAPAGDGFGAVKIDLAGGSALAGSLADGSKLSFKSTLSDAGDWAIYVPCSCGIGAIFGWLVVDPTNATAISGTLHWLRPSGFATGYYTNGFALDAAVAGSVYAPPGTNHILDLAGVQTVLEGGNQPAMTNTSALGPGNRCTNLGPYACSLIFKTAHGTFSGSLVPGPGPGLKPVKFQGALLQSQLLGGGYFIGTNRIGRVSIGP